MSVFIDFYTKTLEEFSNGDRKIGFYLSDNQLLGSIQIITSPPPILPGRVFRAVTDGLISEFPSYGEAKDFLFKNIEINWNWRTL